MYIYIHGETVPYAISVGRFRRVDFITPVREAFPIFVAAISVVTKTTLFLRSSLSLFSVDIFSGSRHSKIRPGCNKFTVCNIPATFLPYATLLQHYLQHAVFCNISATSAGNSCNTHYLQHCLQHCLQHGNCLQHEFSRFRGRGGLQHTAG